MSSSASKSDKKATKRPIPSMKESNFEVGAMMLPSLYRLTEGLPRKELKMMVSEALVCEEALEEEIRLLQDALESPNIDVENRDLQAMLDTEVTPPDRFFTVSSLLGRLRDELTTPLPPNSSVPAHRALVGAFPLKKKQKKDEPTESSNPVPTPSVDHMSTLDKQKQVLALYNNPEYSKEHRQAETLLSLWKKISSHRSSMVFRRPVNPKEAPGYTERISFPMDLSLIRKMIVARQIKSYRDLHQRLGLIAHNCVKYNGRESDYGVVTRDFESNADEMVLAAVLAATQAARNPTPKSTSPPPPSGGPSATGLTARQLPNPTAATPLSSAVSGEPTSDAKPTGTTKSGES